MAMTPQELERKVRQGESDVQEVVVLFVVLAAVAAVRGSWALAAAQAVLAVAVLSLLVVLPLHRPGSAG